MPLNKSTGNMYEFVTHTWNTVKGSCYHDCSYCYMKRWGKLNPCHFDEKELKTDLGSGNFIFVGSGCDMFGYTVSTEYILKTLKYMDQFDNKYLLQTKSPSRLLKFIDQRVIQKKCVVCTTLESDIYYPEIMGRSPQPIHRSICMNSLSSYVDTYVTIEPIMDFNLEAFVSMILICKPKQVNIGADTGNHHLPEPSKEKILQLIGELEKFTIVHQKKNLKRLLK